MTAIETCGANQLNAFNYMLALARNPEVVKEDPGNWMPWNFKPTLPQAHAPRAV